MAMDDENLIIAVQKHSAIYDKSNKYYSNKIYARRVWENISEGIEQPIDWCQKRWRYFRDYFVRQLRNQRTDGSQRKKPWQYYDLLSFLIPYVSQKDSANGIELDQTNGRNSSMSDISTNSIVIYNTDANNQYNSNHSNEISETAEVETYVQSEGNDNVEEPKPERPPKRKKRKIMCEYVQPSPVNKDILSMVKQQSELDEHEHFLKSLLPSIREIHNKYKLLFRTELHHLILKYQQFEDGLDSEHP